MLITDLNKTIEIVYKWKKNYIYLHFTQKNGLFLIQIKNVKPKHIITIKHFSWNNVKWTKVNENHLIINKLPTIQLLLNAAKQTVKKLYLAGIGFKWNTYKNKKILRTGTFNKNLLLTFQNIKWNLTKKSILHLKARHTSILSLIWKKAIKLYKQNKYKKKGLFIKNQIIKLKTNKLNKN